MHYISIFLIVQVYISSLTWYLYIVFLFVYLIS